MSWRINRTSKRQRLSALAILAGGLVVLGVALVVRLGAGETPVVATGDPGADDAPQVGVTPASELPGPVTPAPTASAALADPAQLLREGQFERAAEAFAGGASRTDDPALKAEALTGASAARWEAGDQGEAIRLARQALDAAPKDSPWARQAAFALALRLGAVGRDAEAADALAPFLCPCTTRDAVQPYLEAEDARALAASGRLPAARAEWDALLAAPELPAGLASAIYRARADAEKDHGDPAEYRRWLAEFVRATGNASAWYELGTALDNAGDHAGALREWRAVVAQSPTAAASVKAIAAIEAAGGTVDPGQAGFAYYRRGDFLKAIAVLEGPAYDATADGDTLAFRAFYLGASYEDADRPADAVREYDRAASFASKSYTHRAKYWAARVTEGTGDWAGAATRYVVLASEGPAGEFSAEASFRAGYALLGAGDVQGALGAWDAVLAAGGVADARLYFWRARAFEQSGQADAARDAYQRAAAAPGRSFYGDQAAIELGLRAPFDVRYQERTYGGYDWPAVVAAAGTVGPVDVPPMAAVFAAIGMDGRARALLLAQADGAGPAGLAALAKEADRLQLPSAVAQLGTRLMAKLALGHDTPRAVLQLAYPVGYTGILDAEGKRYGIDPLFLAALIRQESFWDAGAGSGAGALGLTQVIPPTGEAIAAGLGVAFHPDDLLRPAVSIRFGANYVAGQLARFGGDPYRALAAYNAGPVAAARWVRAAGGDPAGFVEAVDYDETHDYVQRVMEHYSAYLEAYAR